MGLPPMPYSWTLDGVSFDTGDDADGNSYAVLTSKGWPGSPPARPDLQPRPSGPGAYRGANYDGPRIVELDGVAQAQSRAAREVLADNLAGLCRDPDALYPLVRNELSRSLSLTVERQGAVDVTEQPDGVTLTFNILLIANEPRKFSTEVKQAITGIAQAALEGVQWDGLTLPATGTIWNGPAIPITGLAWQASSGTSGVLNLNNDGTQPTPILFTITAPLSGTLPMPTLTDVTNGNVISYAGTMAAGDVLVIDTKTGNCLLNGYPVGGAFARSEFFEIPARSSIQVQFSAGGPADTAQLKAEWSDAF